MKWTSFMNLDEVLTELRASKIKEELIPLRANILLPDVTLCGKTQQEADERDAVDVISEVYATGSVRQLFDVVVVNHENNNRLHHYLLPQLVYVMKHGGVGIIISDTIIESRLPSNIVFIDKICVPAKMKEMTMFRICDGSSTST
jgi:hypothetical protein